MYNSLAWTFQDIFTKGVVKGVKGGGGEGWLTEEGVVVCRYVVWSSIIHTMHMRRRDSASRTTKFKATKERKKKREK